MKTCTKCSVEKTDDAFYNKHSYECKECVKARNRIRIALKSKDPEWVLQELKRQRLKAKKTRLEGRASPQKNETKKRWRERNPEAYKAHVTVNNAIRDGRLKRQRCHCGRKAQAHHDDYSKPLEVLWLCTKHHAEHHVAKRQN